MRAWEAALRQRLRPEDVSLPEAGRAAAVALVLRDIGQPEVLLIQRVEREGDPWSGQIALPGGMHSPTDRSLSETARREALEEVALDVTETCGLLGQLSAVRPRNVPTLTVFPFVYGLRREAALRPGDEVEEIFWSALERIRASEAVRSVAVRGHPLQVPAFLHGEKVIWGLTHRILTDFFALGVLP